MTSAGPILIVGAGPVGLTAAILLKLRGIDAIVVERRDALVALPQAHVVNIRTMEIFDEIGVAEAVRGASRTLDKTRNVVWCESLAGREYGRIAAPVGDPAFKAALARISDHGVANIAQNILEPILLARLEALGGAVRFGHELVAIDDAEAPRARIRGLSGDYTVTHDCVLACDGAGSVIRRQLDIGMTGPRSIARFLTIYFEADLRDLVADREGPLFWVAGPDVRGFFIWFDYARTWAFLCPVGDAPLDRIGDAGARAILANAIGLADRRVDIIGLSSWNMSAQIAEAFGRGRIFLLGDAAHRFPPTGGLGLNTGVQDAHNLAWKLAAVRDGWAAPQLLDSYEVERRPVAIRNCEQSVFNFRRMTEVDDALGIPTLTPVDPDAATGPIRRFPADTLRLDGDDAAAHARRADVAAAIDRQKGHFQISFGAQLGFRYEHGALVSDGTDAPPDLAEVYEPIGRPGSRLPHFRLDDGTSIHRALLRDQLTMVSANPAWPAALDAATASSGLPATGLLIAATASDELGIGRYGAVLVRPDGHVAWRAADAPGPDDRLADVLAHIAGVRAPPPA